MDNIECPGFTKLMRMCLLGSSANEIEKLLKSEYYGSECKDINEVDGDGCTALLHASTFYGYVRSFTDLYKKNKKEIIRLLVKYGANVNAMIGPDPVPILYYSIVRHNTEIVQTLIDCGADPNITYNNEYNNGHTLLMRTCSLCYNDDGIADILIRAGANVNAKNSSGKTALYTACMYSNPEIAISLLKAGADPNTTVEGEHGKTPLLLSCYNTCEKYKLEALQALLDAGANPNVQETYYEDTPLSIACMYDANKAILILIMGGADPYVKQGPDPRTIDGKRRSPLSHPYVAYLIENCIKIQRWFRRIKTIQ